MPEPLYIVCRLTAVHLEAFDPADIEPERVYGPASMDGCLIFVGRSLQSDYFLLEEGEVTQ